MQAHRVSRESKSLIIGHGNSPVRFLACLPSLTDSSPASSSTAIASDHVKHPVKHQSKKNLRGEIKEIIEQTGGPMDPADLGGSGDSQRTAVFLLLLGFCCCRKINRMLCGKAEKHVRECSLTCGRNALDRMKHPGGALFRGAS